MTSLLRRHRKKFIALVIVVALPTVMHFAIRSLTTMSPPPIATVSQTTKSWTAKRGVRIASLGGTPEEIGAAHSALLYDRMIETERVVWDGFRHLVPFAPARLALFDFGRFRYRNVEGGFPTDRRKELAAEAAGFAPDPFASQMPTYSRMVFLHALYDISLGFEHSPLLGCTAFGLGPAATRDGHALFARAFDFDAADVFDREKVAFLVREDGAIPFLSIAWPGFVGVVTGMNAEGVAVAVHGGRARDPSPRGLPVAFGLRDTLSQAHDIHEALAILSRQDVMVSHIVFVGDASGSYAVVERAPGETAYVRNVFPDSARVAVTNHFEGPLAGDPKDETVRRTTTTLARRARVDELLRKVEPRSGDVPRAVSVMRDHGCAGEEGCPPGDRRSLDPFIATHGVVFDLTARTAWVSEGPHLSGRFVKIDLPALVSRGAMPPTAEELAAPVESVGPDPALTDARYVEGRKRAGAPLLGGEAR